MTIQYALTRTEIALGFFRSLRTSPRFLLTICSYAVGFGVFQLLISGALSRPLTIQDATTAAIVVVAFFAFMPALLSLRGKTSLRTLTVSPQGIYTEIGEMRAQRPWSKIKIVSEAQEYVLIAGASGNAFFIPNRAFATREQKAEFVTQIKTWQSQATTIR